MKEKEKKIIQETTDELFKLLGIDAKFEISLKGKDEERIIDVVLDTEDTGIIIGYHGETLEALQLILSLCIARKMGMFIRVSVEAGDYKKNRTQWLEDVAKQTKDQVLEEGREIAIPSLRSWERRVVHLFLQDDQEVVAASQGEGRDRVLIVSPKK